MRARRAVVAASAAAALAAGAAPAVAGLPVPPPGAPATATSEGQRHLGTLPVGRVARFSGVVTTQGSLGAVLSTEYGSAGAFPVNGKLRPPDELCGTWYTCHDWTFRLESVPAGARLRVALDGSQGYPGNYDGFDLLLYPPADDGRASTTTPSCRPPGPRDEVHGTDVRYVAPFSYEAFVEPGRGPEGCDVAPRPGTWTVRVIAAAVSEDEQPADAGLRAAYEGRAVLEVPSTKLEGQPLLPNLVPALPPWDVHLGCLEDYPEPALRRGEEPPECLRFAFAYGNTGDGMFAAHFATTDPQQLPPDGQPLSVPITQRVYRGDRTPGHYADNHYEDIAVGASAHFHATHRHWHVDDFYEVVLRPLAGGDERTAAKRGICTTAWFLVDLDVVRPDGIDAGASEGCDTEHLVSLPGRTRIELPAGWGDMYLSFTPDNSVDVTGLHDGLHVLVFRLNPRGAFLETTTADNTAYAVVKLRTDGSTREVCLVERGFGDGPRRAPAASRCEGPPRRAGAPRE